MQDSLCVLNISGNNIDDIGDLRVLRKLQHFSAADNNLHQVAVKQLLIENKENLGNTMNFLPGLCRHVLQRF